MAVNNPGAGGGGASFTQGTFAARPAASPNALYFATDTGEWWIANAAGNAWQSLASVTGNWTLNGGTLNIPGVVANINTGGGQVSVRGFLGTQNAGLGFRAAEGANAKQGTAVLVAGTVTVANTSVTTTSRIFLTGNTDGGTVGFPRVSARTAGTSFTITSSSAADTSTDAYQIFEPG